MSIRCPGIERNCPDDRLGIQHFPDQTEQDKNKDFRCKNLDIGVRNYGSKEELHERSHQLECRMFYICMGYMCLYISVCEYVKS